MINRTTCMPHDMYVERGRVDRDKSLVFGISPSSQAVNLTPYVITLDSSRTLSGLRTSGQQIIAMYLWYTNLRCTVMIWIRQSTLQWVYHQVSDSNEGNYQWLHQFCSILLICLGHDSSSSNMHQPVNRSTYIIYSQWKLPYIPIGEVTIFKSWM